MGGKMRQISKFGNKKQKKGGTSGEKQFGRGTESPIDGCKPGIEEF